MLAELRVGASLLTELWVGATGLLRPQTHSTRHSTRRVAAVPHRAQVSFEEILDEHSATNVVEYERVLSSGPRGALVRFVYDVPDLLERAPDALPLIFARKPAAVAAAALGAKEGHAKTRAQHELSRASLEDADECGTSYKNVRGELPTILLTPQADADYSALELPLTLAMTRSLGDFYMHTFGVTWRPEVRQVPLAPLCAKLEHLTLIIASDGVWDSYEYEDVFSEILSPPTTAGQSLETAHNFLETQCRLRGDELFGRAADNMTGIVVYLNPQGTKTIERAPVTAPPKSKPAPDPKPTPPVPAKPSVSKAAPPPPPPPASVAIEEDDDDVAC